MNTLPNDGWKRTALRLGGLSASAVVVVGIIYVIVLALGMARYGLSEPIGDPILAVMEILTLASALTLVFLATSILMIASDERRVWGILALCFTVMFASTTIGVHLVELTAGRQLGTHGLVWPSTAYAVELLAWDLFLGLALLFAAAALDPARRTLRMRRIIQATGVLCLLGLVGPAVGNMRLQLIGVLGYAVMLPLAAFELARWFHREYRSNAA